MFCSPECPLVSEIVKQKGTEGVADNEGDLLKPVKSGHPAGSVLHRGDVGCPAVDREVPDGAAPHHVVDVGQPEILQPQLGEPDLVHQQGDAL